jgi:hypothetical protein
MVDAAGLMRWAVAAANAAMEADQLLPRRRFQFRLPRIPWWECIKVGTVGGSTIAILSWTITEVSRVRLPGLSNLVGRLMILVPFCIVIAIFTLYGDD